MDNSDKVNYLITGASGYIGQELCRNFSDKGIETRGLYRYSRPQARPFVYPVCCNLFQEQPLRQVLHDVDVLVHLAWQGHQENNKKDSENIGENESEGFANLKMTKTVIKVAEVANV